MIITIMFSYTVVNFMLFSLVTVVIFKDLYKGFAISDKIKQI